MTSKKVLQTAIAIPLGVVGAALGFALTLLGPTAVIVWILSKTPLWPE